MTFAQIALWIFDKSPYFFLSPKDGESKMNLMVYKKLNKKSQRKTNFLIVKILKRQQRNLKRIILYIENIASHSCGLALFTRKWSFIVFIYFIL